MGTDEPRDQVIRPELVVQPSAFPPTVAKHYRHAPEWFVDAKAEAEREGQGARRREILFAICLAESYLTEWVLTEGLQDTEHQFFRFFIYFPELDRRGLTELWKQTMDQLYDEGILPSKADLGGPHGVEWLHLIRYRDGLVHASASRPSVSSPRVKLMVEVWDANELPEPMPSREDLDALSPGWALGVVVERIERLHEAAGSPTPEWLTG